MSTSSNVFPTETKGLPRARSPEVVELADGDEFDLRIAPVRLRSSCHHGGQRMAQRARR